jgi:hypothetical protein
MAIGFAHFASSAARKATKTLSKGLGRERLEGSSPGRVT